MSVPGVTGIGIGIDDRTAERVIKVYVDRLTPELKKRVPSKLDGYPVIVEVTGELKAFNLL